MIDPKDTETGMPEPDPPPSRESPPLRRLPGAGSILAAMLILITTMSLGRWFMEGKPKRLWRERQPPSPTEQWCPDGMDRQIEGFARLLKGDEFARENYLPFLRRSHQSSTYLVDLMCAPFVIAGVEPAVAFAVVSTLASLLLVLLLWRFSGREFDFDRRSRLLVVALFLCHPGTVRCFSRPQTDALLGLFAFAGLIWGRRLAGAPSSLSLRVAVALTGLAACFVKIHALGLLLVVPAVAFLYGARGRRLLDALIWATLIPALAWITAFASLDLFSSVERAWEFKDQFYAQWNPGLIAKVGAITFLPLLAMVALHRRWTSGLAPAAGLIALGFATILFASQIPPLVRFQYPALAPLALVAVAAMRDRWPGRRGAAVVAALAGWWFLVAATQVGIQLYARYLGPSKEVAPSISIFLQ